MAHDPSTSSVFSATSAANHICVPLVVRGRADWRGLIYGESAPGQPYTLTDLALAEEFTDRAAVAVDNAMLYTKE